MSNDFDEVSKMFSPILKEIWELIKPTGLDCVIFLRKPEENLDEPNSVIFGNAGTHTLAECMYHIADRSPMAFYVVARELIAQGKLEVLEESEVLEKMGFHFSKVGGNA